MRPSRTCTSIGACAAALTLAGCGGLGDPIPPDRPANPGVTGHGPDTLRYGIDQAVRTAHIRIRGDGYEPSTLVIRAGTPLTWTNVDDEPHNVTSVDGASQEIRSRRIAPGESFSTTATMPGRTAYRSTAPGDDEGFSGRLDIF